MQKQVNQKYLFWGIVGLLVIMFGIAGGLGYFYYQIRNELILTKTELLNTQSDLAQLTEEAEILSQNLEAEKYKNSLFEGQISEIAGTVGTLDKLAKTDKELLQKYSKVYFLNEHYLPDELALVPAEFIYEKDKEIKIHAKVLPYLLALLGGAEKGGVDLKIISGFRSFGEQSSLKNSYIVSYGSGANKFSADQGYSEHQLGTTLDFTTIELGSNFTAFAKTEEYNWLKENAYKYGFILSYPEGNTYYQFEPWHFRFVGKKLSERLHEEKENFYDLNQNIIDAYLINIFD